MNNDQTNMTDEMSDSTSPLLEAVPMDNEPKTQASIPSLLTIGELLRSKREEKDLSLKVISQQTKIHIGLLEHLEKNELSKLPSKTYVRGFVKSAAKILGINQDIALNALEATYTKDIKFQKAEVPNIEIKNEAVRNTLSTISTTPLEAVKSVTASSTAFLAKSFIAILFIGIVGFNIKNFVDKSAEEHLKLPKVLSTIHQKMRTAPKTAAPKIAVKSELETTKTAPIQVNIIQDKKDTIQKTDITINDVNLKNISLGEKQFTEDNSLSEETLNEVFPTRFRVNPSKGVENIFINATEGDSWITYKVDDKEIKKYVLRQGRTVFIRGEKVRLFIGNTKSVKVFYNNKLIALKGTTKNLVFPEELKTKYMSPLFIFQKDGTAVTSDEFIKSNQTPAPSTPVKKL